MPLPIDIVPDGPPDDVPELNTKAPLTPVTPAFTDLIMMPPLDVAVPAPDSNVNAPPVIVVPAPPVSDIAPPPFAVPVP